MKEQVFSRLLIAFSVFVVFWFFILNIYTPLIADDYNYSLGIHSVSDIIKSQYNFYFVSDGRNVSFSLIEFWLLAGKPFFDIANTLVYCAFILLVQFHITGNLKKISPGLFLAINVFFWFFTPAWGQNFLWLTGSCHYLWTAVTILLFLVPFRKRQDNPDYALNLPLSILFFPAGILAGWSMENSAAAALFLLIAYFVTKIARKDRLTLFEILGAIGFLIGFSLLIASPGKINRVGIYREWGLGYSDDPFLVKYIKRFLDITRMFIGNHGFLLISISAILGFDHMYHQKRKLQVFSYFYALAALASVYSMLLAPVFEVRTFLGVLVFSVITLGNVLLQMDLQLPNIIKRNAAVVLITIVLIPSAYPVLVGTRAIMEFYLRWYDRLEYILAEKEKGNLSIEVRPLIAVEKHTVLNSPYNYFVYKDENRWENKAIADYFGIDSIKANDEDPWESLWPDKRKRIRQLFTPPWGLIKKIRGIE